MKIYAIGDIHGMFNPLQSLINKINLEPDDLLIFLGDYIDRGPDSKKVLDFLIKLNRRFNIIALRGNHEDMYLKALKTDNIDDWYIWRANGGTTTEKSYLTCKMDKKHIEFLNTLQSYYESDNYIFVHAGATPGMSIKDTCERDRLWIRERFIDSNYDWGKKIIFGHTIFRKGPFIRFNKIGIDTGAFIPGGKLTAIKLPEEIFIQS